MQRERHLLVFARFVSAHLHPTDEETGLDRHIVCVSSRKSTAWPREFSLPLNFTRTQGSHIPQGSRFSIQREGARGPFISTALLPGCHVVSLL